jgi:hypothetical protein
MVPGTGAEPKKVTGQRVTSTGNLLLIKRTRDAPDIRPDSPAFFDIRTGIRPNTKLVSRICGKAGYRISG